MAIRDLSLGMQGEDVRALQQGLNRYFEGRRPALDPDGRFGASTQAAVDAFQSENPGTGRADGTSDGIAGARTRRKLFPLVVVTSTVVGIRTAPPNSSLKDRVLRSFSPGQLQLGLGVVTVFPQLFINPFFHPVFIPRLAERIAAPRTSQTPPVQKNLGNNLWKFDHGEVDPGGQMTFGFSKDRQDAMTMTAQAIFSKGPSDGKHFELATGVQFGIPLHAHPGDGSAWTFNPFVQFTDVDRLGALGLFHFWQPYAQVGVQGAFARNVSPTLTVNAFPINLGFDAGSKLTFTLAGGAVFNFNMDTGATQFGGQFTFGANFKFGAPEPSK